MRFGTPHCSGPVVHSQNPAPGVSVAMYFTIGAPPSSVGAVQLIRTVWPPSVAVTVAGAAGAPGLGVTALLNVEKFDVPIAFVARIPIFWLVLHPARAESFDESTLITQIAEMTITRGRIRTHRLNLLVTSVIVAPTWPHPRSRLSTCDSDPDSA